MRIKFFQSTCMCLCSWEVGRGCLKGGPDLILSLGIKNLSLFVIFIRFCSWSLETLSRKHPHLTKLYHFYNKRLIQTRVCCFKKLCQRHNVFPLQIFLFLFFFFFERGYWEIFNHFINTFPKPTGQNPRICRSDLCLLLVFSDSRDTSRFF